MEMPPAGDEVEEDPAVDVKVVAEDDDVEEDPAVDVVTEDDAGGLVKEVRDCRCCRSSFFFCRNASETTITMSSSNRLSFLLDTISMSSSGN